MSVRVCDTSMLQMLSQGVMKLVCTCVCACVRHIYVTNVIAGCNEAGVRVCVCACVRHIYVTNVIAGCNEAGVRVCVCACVRHIYVTNVIAGCNEAGCVYVHVCLRVCATHLFYKCYCRV